MSIHIPHVDAVIDLMAQGKILPYLDIPFQHASPKVLKLMKRPAHSENTLERLKLWREKCPDLVIAFNLRCRVSQVKLKKILKSCLSG